MPTEAPILGFENRWHGESFAHAVEIRLPTGGKIRAIPPAFLLATKLEAFAARGNQDFLSSRDFSDVVTLIDGREELVQEVAGAPARLQSYVGKELLQLASHRDFNRGLEGALPSSPESQARVDRVVLPRIRQLMAPAEGALME